MTRGLLVRATFMGFVVAFLFLLSSCGYRIAYHLPPDIHSIAIPILKNETYEPGIEVPITNEIITEFLRDGSLKIRKKRDSDLLLLGKITSYKRNPIAFDAEDTDEPIEYRFYIRIWFSLKNMRTNKVLWKIGGLTGKTTYFVRGNYSKTESEALREATENLAQKLVERVVESW